MADGTEFVRVPLEGGGSALIDADDEELVRSLGEWSRTGPGWSCYSKYSDDGKKSYEFRRHGNYWDWHSHTHVAYSYIPLGEGEPMSGGTRVYLHELVMGAREGQEVYPANGNGLDCRKINLRIRQR